MAMLRQEKPGLLGA